MSIDTLGVNAVAALGGVGGVGGVSKQSFTGAALPSEAGAVEYSTPGLAQLSTAKAEAASGSSLLDGVSVLKIPDTFLTGNVTAVDLASLNVELLNFTMGVTAMSTLRKELSTVKTHLLSEGKN